MTSGDLNLTNADFQVPPAPIAGPDGTTYFTGRDGVASDPGEPALPRFVANVDVPGKVLRGVGFLSGTFAETAGVKPFTGSPGTEFGGAQTPFTSPTFYPARMWAASYFAELSGGATSLVVKPAQHRVVNVGDATALRRLYSSLGPSPVLRRRHRRRRGPRDRAGDLRRGGHGGRIDGHVQRPGPRHRCRRARTTSRPPG